MTTRAVHNEQLLSTHPQRCDFVLRYAVRIFRIVGETPQTLFAFFEVLHLLEEFLVGSQ